MTTMMANITENWKLKEAMEYIANPEKTENGKYVVGINCAYDWEGAYKQFWDTKEHFGQDLKPRRDGKSNRLAYHYKFSFKPGEVDEIVAWEILLKIYDEFLGDQYEGFASMHTDHAHLHGHLIFNSVNALNGKKYHYKKGDWRQDIQVMVNRITAEYGLSTIDLEEVGKKNRSYDEHLDHKNHSPNLPDALRLMIDRAICETADYESFKHYLLGEGFEITRDGEYLAIINRQWGMQKSRRTYKLGSGYGKSEILARIRKHFESGIDPLYSTELLDRSPAIKSPKIIAVRRRHIRAVRIQISHHYLGYHSHHWQILRMWNSLLNGTALPKTRHSADLREFRKNQEKVRLLLRYNIHTDADLQEAIARITVESKLMTGALTKMNHVAPALLESTDPDTDIDTSLDRNDRNRSEHAAYRKKLAAVKRDLRVLQTIHEESLIRDQFPYTTNGKNDDTATIKIKTEQTGHKEVNQDENRQNKTQRDVARQSHMDRTRPNEAKQDEYRHK